MIGGAVPNLLLLLVLHGLGAILLLLGVAALIVRLRGL